MADQYPTEDPPPPLAKVNVDKYMIDSDADSSDPDAYIQDKPLAGPIADAAAEAEAEQKAQEEAKAAEEKRKADAAREAAEKECPPNTEYAPAPAVKHNSRDSDSDEDEDEDEEKRSEDGAATDAIESAKDKEDEYPVEDPASAAAVAVSDEEGEADAPQTVAAPARTEEVEKEEPRAGNAETTTTTTTTTTATAAAAATAAATATTAADEEGKKDKARKAAPATTNKREGDVKAHKKSEAKPVRKARKGKVEPGDARPGDEATMEGSAPPPPPPATTTTGEKPKKKKKKAAAAAADVDKSDAKGKKLRKGKAGMAPAAAADDVEGDGAGNDDAGAQVKDPKGAAAQRSHEKKRQAKMEKLAAAYSDAANTSNRSNSGGDARQRIVFANAFVGTESIPGIIRRSTGGAGGLHAVGAARTVTRSAVADTSSHGASVGKNSESNMAHPPASGTHSEPPQRSVTGATKTMHTAPVADTEAESAFVSQRRRHSTTSHDASVSRYSRGPAGSVVPLEQTADPAAMLAFFRSLENTITVNEGGVSQTYVDANDLPPLPPGLVSTVAAHYESCLLQLPSTEVERTVACLCASEKDRKPVMAYLREKLRILQRQQQRQRSSNATLEAYRAQAFAAGAHDASKRGTGVQPANNTSGDGNSASAEATFTDPAALAALQPYENDHAVRSYKSFFTQQSCAAFLEEHVEACIARRQRYYDNQPAIVRAKKIIVEESQLVPLYSQSVHSLLYQMLGLTEAECTKRGYTEPVVKAVMSRMPPVIYPSETDNAKDGADGADGAEASNHVPVAYYSAAVDAEQQPPQQKAEEEEGGGGEDVEAAAAAPSSQEEADSVKGEEDAAYVPYTGDGDEGDDAGTAERQVEEGEEETTSAHEL